MNCLRTDTEDTVTLIGEVNGKHGYWTVMKYQWVTYQQSFRKKRRLTEAEVERAIALI